MWKRCGEKDTEKDRGRHFSHDLIYCVVDDDGPFDLECVCVRERERQSEIGGSL